MSTITVAILTVSDSCFLREKPDRSGPKLEECVKNALKNCQISEKAIVPDDEGQIISVLSKWCCQKITLILTTGGTGLGPRDVTPEATKKVIEREASGLAYAMIMKSLEITPMSMLSRPICGIKDQSLIINLPGSVKGAYECFNFTLPALPHALALITNNEKIVSKDHARIQNVTLSPSKVKINNVAGRPRTSPYELFEIDKALEIIFEQMTERQIEDVGIDQALNRVLAEDIFSSEAIPPFDASIKDGYAVVAEDGTGLRFVRNFLAAGDAPLQIKIGRGETVRICTGAPLPEGADAVVQVEDTSLVKTTSDGLEEVEISIEKTPIKGQDIRFKGSDISPGTKIFDASDRIGPAHIGVLATIGKSQIKVYKQCRVGVISTGNELIDYSDIPKPGQIRDSNRITLINLLNRFNYEIKDYGIARDEPNSLKTTISKALRNCDLLITTGGVSMGEFDLIKEILKQDFKATIHFGRVNMKPGKPTTFATLNYEGKSKMFFGLPGNPVSACVTCLLFVLPVLKYSDGARGDDMKLPTIDAISEETVTNSDNRPEYLRVSVVKTGDHVRFKSTGNQISSRLNSLVGANALALIPPKTAIQSGDKHQLYLIGNIV